MSEFITDGTNRPHSFQKWHRCVLCSLSYPEGEMKLFRGSWYGVPCGDHRDIGSILRKEHAAHDREKTRSRINDQQRR